jgi:hypothetical protein
VYNTIYTNGVINLTNEELAYLKNQDSIQDKIQLERIKSRMLELERDPKVKEYIQLSNGLYDDKEASINNEFYKTCDEMAKVAKQSASIFYDFGEYNYRDIETLDLRKFRVYRNLENSKWYYMSENNELITFPSGYVIKLSNDDDNHRFENDKIIFDVLRTQFFEKLILNSYEEAVNNIIKISKILINPKVLEKTDSSKSSYDISASLDKFFDNMTEDEIFAYLDSKGLKYTKKKIKK